MSDSDAKIVGHRFKNSDSFNYSFELTNSGKMNSSDDENSRPDSCSSIQTLGNEKTQTTDKPRSGLKSINSTQSLGMKQNKGLSLKSLNESHLPKVNWIIGFEEASSRNIFDCLWINTEKINKIVKQKCKELVQRFVDKSQRDHEISQMLPESEISSELYHKKKNNNISAVVSTILKDAGIIGNPIQNMMARNIRHFENISCLNFDKREKMVSFPFYKVFIYYL